MTLAIDRKLNEKNLEIHRIILNVTWSICCCCKAESCSVDNCIGRFEIMFCPLCKLDIAPTSSELDMSGEDGLHSLGSDDELVNPVVEAMLNWLC